MTLLTTREVAELLRYKPGYIRELVMKRKIPYIKLGRSVRFDKEDIEKLIKDNYVEKSTPWRE